MQSLPKSVTHYDQFGFRLDSIWFQNRLKKLKDFHSIKNAIRRKMIHYMTKIVIIAKLLLTTNSSKFFTIRYGLYGLSIEFLTGEV